MERLIEWILALWVAPMALVLVAGVVVWLIGWADRLLDRWADWSDRRLALALAGGQLVHEADLYLADLGHIARWSKWRAEISETVS